MMSPRLLLSPPINEEPESALLIKQLQDQMRQLKRQLVAAEVGVTTNLQQLQQQLVLSEQDVQQLQAELVTAIAEVDTEKQLHSKSTNEVRELEGMLYEAMSELTDMEVKCKVLEQKLQKAVGLKESDDCETQMMRNDTNLTAKDRDMASTISLW
jgi:chromosome segregation ATPase